MGATDAGRGMGMPKTDEMKKRRCLRKLSLVGAGRQRETAEKVGRGGWEVTSERRCEMSGGVGVVNAAPRQRFGEDLLAQCAARWQRPPGGRAAPAGPTGTSPVSKRETIDALLIGRLTPDPPPALRPRGQPSHPALTPRSHDLPGAQPGVE